MWALRAGISRLPYLATCQGGPAYNGFYGHGQINALSAISK
jgi:hypothetical protein